jgi:hypothetical protein
MKKKLESNKYILDKITIGYIEKKLFEINKKRDRLIKKGRIPEDFPVIKLEYKEIGEDLAKALMSVMDKNEKFNFKGRYREHVLVSLNSDKVPKLDDWSVLGMLEKIEGSTNFTMTSFVDSNKIPSKYRDADPCNCDHCGHNRKRNSTFIIKNEESNELMQVGKSCMKDFVSSESLEMLMLYSSINQILDTFDPEEYSRGGVDSLMLSKKDFLAAVNACMKVTGEYVSYSKADIVHERPHTKLMATHCLDNQSLSNYVRQHKSLSDGTYPEYIKKYESLIKSIKIEDSDYEHVDKVIDYFEKKPPKKSDSDFYFNLYNLITSEAVFLDEKKLGLVAYTIEHYNKEQKEDLFRNMIKDKEAKSFDLQPYIAKEKEKIESVEVSLEGVFIIDGYEYGDSFVYNLKTRDGRDVSWKYSNCGVPECLLDKDLDSINTIKSMISSLRDKDEKIWMVLKGSCSGQYAYQDKKGVDRKITQINRASSIGDFTTEPKTDGVIYRNDKYNISQFKVDKVLEAESSQTGEKHFKYELSDKDENSFIMYSFKKIDGLKEDKVFTIPHQKFNSEIMGYMTENIKLEESFTPSFQDCLVTKNKASKFNQSKKLKQSKG